MYIKYPVNSNAIFNYDIYYTHASISYEIWIFSLGNENKVNIYKIDNHCMYSWHLGNGNVHLYIN